MRRKANPQKFGDRIGAGPSGIRIVPSVQPTPRNVKNAPRKKAKPGTTR